MLTSDTKQEVVIKIDVKDNNVEQAIRVLKENCRKRAFQSYENEKHLRKTF